MRSSITTFALALWAPILAGGLATAMTWLVWFYTGMPCTSENAVELMCRPNLLSRYLSPTVLNDCVIHSGIAVTITGGSDIMLFIRERQRNEQERQRNEQERQHSDRILELVKEALDQAAEERRQAAEERRQAAEERRQADVERQAFLEALNRLTDAIGQNR